MSVLSRPQGTPDRVWSLISGLKSAEFDLTPDDFLGLLNPGYNRAGVTEIAKTNLARDATGVANALGLVERENSLVCLRVADIETLDDMRDAVHRSLLTCQEGTPDAVILDAYSWLVAESHRRKELDWILATPADALVDMMSAGLIGEDEDGSRPMNTTKLPALRRWLEFIGLGVFLPIGKQTPFYPSAAKRISVELQREMNSVSNPMTGIEFLDLLSTLCPYLDQGILFRRACERIGYTANPRQLSAIATVSLREIEAQGLIEFNLVGDSSDAISFVHDPSFKTNSFNQVKLIGGKS
ncbi:hypothetical protein [Ruegeria sp. HKCCSP335]|uniref:hypothetical protein n=1 Tax=Ruegeria sp. HKCCSP335 TaxID=2794833 RepID=UPI001AEBA1AA|nr:hypothetical protein [Ruegeria sp. HKCCSP335]